MTNSMTICDVLWRFMSMGQRDGNCHKMSRIVVNHHDGCCKLSWRFFPSSSCRPLFVFADKRVVFADVLPERKPERGYVRMFPRNEKRNEGTFACSPGTKTGTRVHSPKPPFYETILLSPGENIPCKKNKTGLLPFVRIHSRNNSKIIFLCICICYEIDN